MSNEITASWVGASGSEYTFYVFGLEPDVPTRSGLYIYAKRNADDAWVPVYMGHGDLTRRCADPALLQAIATRAPTHVHLRLNTSAEDQAAERADLLSRYGNAFAPDGCQPEADRPPPGATPEGGAPPPSSAATPPAGAHLSDPLPDPT